MSDSTTASDSVQAESVLGQSSTLVNRLLANRGITDQAEAERFLAPDYDDGLHDPWLMKGMALATERIRQAIDQNERVLIYADYDADGIPGAVALEDFFQEIGFANFQVYVPHRHDEGFGMHLEAVDQFARDRVGLLVTVDCGITDVIEVRRAQEHGIDVVLTDHHEPNGQLPPAVAILDPKQSDCSYPDKHLCGAGVIFKLIQALSQSPELEFRAGREKWFLDMVGLATLSDMVPLVGENRVLAYYGLKVLRRTPRPGLVEMLKRLRIDQRHLTEDDIGYMITPRINAASRMGVSMDAYHFLASRKPASAAEAVEHLNRVNDERKGLVASIVKKVNRRLKQDSTLSERPVIVAGDPNWRPSLLGLVAGKLAEEYDRPVFLWGRDGQGQLKGSARSDGRVNLVEMMEAVDGAVVGFGGHSQAGGFEVDHEQVHFLPDRLAQAWQRYVSEQSAGGEADVDQDRSPAEVDLTLDDVNSDVCSQIERLAPFGVGNPKPIFRFKQVEIKGVKSFGRQGDHLELAFKNSAGRDVKAINFFKRSEDFEPVLQVGQVIDLLAHLERSFFGGREEVRLRIVDVVN